MGNEGEEGEVREDIGRGCSLFLPLLRDEEECEGRNGKKRLFTVSVSCGG